MLLQGLFILCAVGAVIGEEQECQPEVLRKCNNTDVPSEIPDTMDDLNRYCRVVRDAAKCMVEVSEKCNLHHFDVRNFRKVAQFLESNCDEGSSLYQALSRNYECIQPLAKNMGDKCKLSEEGREEMINLGAKAEGLPETAEHCQHALYLITCFGHIIGMRCGQQAEDAVTEILQNILGDFQYCDEESTLSKLQLLKEISEDIFSKTFKGENGHA